MLRKFFADRKHGDHPDFRWRGTDVSRLEGFSDGVFGFAVTLLVVSLDVPDNFAQFWAAMLNTPSFAICFTLLLLVWSEHYHYFRRYGLEDGRTMLINAVLLFVVLIYIYPLKFLFTNLTDMALGINRVVRLPDGSMGPPISDSQWPGLMMLYAAGYIACYGCFLLLYRNAWQQREVLALTPLEQLETRASILDQAMSIGIGLVSLALAALGFAGLSGLCYLLQWPLGMVRGRIVDRWRRALGHTMPAGQAPAADAGPDADPIER
jgi:Endosomal/lysosomal potassium channel TMEM175